MANTKQAKKMVRKTKTKTSYNKWWKTKVKEAYKALNNAISSSSKIEEKNAKMVELQKTVDKAAKNGVIQKNQANRIKSRFAKKLAVKH